jgi:AcrR family transcriptional regulator
MAVPAAAPAGRTRADAVRNRARVIAAAAEVFAEKGEDAVVPEIAARAGVGKGTVYRCFPTKDHLVAAVATERVRWFEREIRAAAAGADPWGAFSAFMARVADAHCADRGMVFSMAQGIALPELVAARADVTVALRELMDRAIAQGAMRPDAEPADLRIMLSGVARALVATGERDPAVWRRYVQFVVDALRA